MESTATITKKETKSFATIIYDPMQNKTTLIYKKISEIAELEFNIRNHNVLEIDEQSVPLNYVMAAANYNNLRNTIERKEPYMGLLMEEELRSFETMLYMNDFEKIIPVKRFDLMKKDIAKDDLLLEQMLNSLSDTDFSHLYSRAVKDAAETNSKKKGNSKEHELDR